VRRLLRGVDLLLPGASVPALQRELAANAAGAPRPRPVAGEGTAGGGGGGGGGGGTLTERLVEALLARGRMPPADAGPHYSGAGPAGPTTSTRGGVVTVRPAGPGPEAAAGTGAAAAGAGPAGLGEGVETGLGFAAAAGAAAASEAAPFASEAASEMFPCGGEGTQQRQCRWRAPRWVAGRRSARASAGGSIARCWSQAMAPPRCNRPELDAHSEYEFE
jgi:hypothetical protein